MRAFTQVKYSNKCFKEPASGHHMAHRFILMEDQGIHITFRSLFHWLNNIWKLLSRRSFQWQAPLFAINS